MNAHLRDDSGSVLPLVVASFAFALALILVVTAASSLYLARKRLLTVADGAATAAAESFDLDAIVVHDGRVRPQLRSADVAAAVDRYLASEPSVAADGIRLESAESADGRSASVSLSLDWRPPMVGAMLPDGVHIEVESSARSVFD